MKKMLDTTIVDGIPCIRTSTSFHKKTRHSRCIIKKKTYPEPILPSFPSLPEQHPELDLLPGAVMILDPDRPRIRQEHDLVDGGVA